MEKLTFYSKNNDRVLKVLQNQFPDVKYSAFVSALRKKDVLIDGKRIKENISVFCGQEITCYVASNSKKQLFEIFYEDENLIIASKDKNIEVCDGENNIELELKKDHPYVKAVHRLDRNTKGLVMFAKSESVLSNLVCSMQNHKIRKFYIAEVVGAVKQKEQKLIGYLVKDKENSLVKIFNNKKPNSVKIQTNYKALKVGQTSLLEVEIFDGKTHQIRAHLAHIGHPIVGDGKYGSNETNKKFNAKTQSLTAYKLVFNLDETNPLCYLNNKKFELKLDYLKLS